MDYSSDYHDTNIYVLETFTITSLASLVFIFYAYYKLIFHQINQQIKSLIPNGKIKFINNRREKKLINLLNDHNQAAIEIHKMNLIMRRTAATMFITFSLLKIISLYLILLIKNFCMKILLANIFVIFFFFGFILTYLYSRQINPAHQSLRFVYSVVCRYKMCLRMRIKVNWSVLILNQSLIALIF